jgi:hypothetical protein
VRKGFLERGKAFLAPGEAFLERGKAFLERVEGFLEPRHAFPGSVKAFPRAGEWLYGVFEATLAGRQAVERRPPSIAAARERVRAARSRFPVIGRSGA